MKSQADNPDIQCEQASEALSAYFDSAANIAEQQLATAHLAQCSSCARMWREWHYLRSMEHRALEPITSGEMLPLATVKVPRHLKAAILRQTVTPPIWQRFWPRLLTGMAVPTAAVACWLLIVAAPWQSSISEIPTSNPVTEKDTEITPEMADTAPPAPKPKLAPPADSPKSEISTPVKVAHSTTNNQNVASHQSASKRISTTNSKKAPTKSTFKARRSSGKSSSRPIVVKTPQISMAAVQRPHSEVVAPVPIKTIGAPAVTPKPRATEPVLIATLTEEDPIAETPNPIVEYIAASDIRPDNIREAVEDYRAALLEETSDL